VLVKQRLDVGNRSSGVAWTSRIRRTNPRIYSARAPTTRDSATEAARIRDPSGDKLPSHHRDPFDRMLICQAMAHGLTLLTPDSQIAKYSVSVIW
jgi:predicted nucleic acid-binding protein